jgi:replicative DNA helicase
VGKSAMAMQFAVHAARTRHAAVVFSHEMSDEECTDRILAMTANVPLPRLRGQGRLDDEHIRRVVEQQQRGIGGMPLWVDDRCSCTATEVATVARRHARRNGTRLIVIDYLQLLRPENPRDPRHLQVGTSAKRLKELARETSAAVLVCAQLNREVEARGDGRPRLSDLRDSGEVEQDADVVFLLHRLDSDPAKLTHDVDLIVSKNRNGPTGDVPLSYQRVYTRFEPRSPQY